MLREETRRKVSETLKRIGHRPKARGGNGKGLTHHEKLIFGLLGAEWVPGFVAVLETPTGRRHPYKIDLAHPTLKIAIEVDGPSHNSLKVRAADLWKQTALEKSGWKVLRFKNEEVESLTTSKLKDILRSA